MEYNESKENHWLDFHQIGKNAYNIITEQTYFREEGCSQGSFRKWHFKYTWIDLPYRMKIVKDSLPTMHFKPTIIIPGTKFVMLYYAQRRRQP